MPAQTPAGRPRSSKLDPYKATIAELLEKDPSASAAVIGQRLRPLGYNGGGSILRQYVHEVRPQLKPQRAFVRMEPKPGERFEADWGHFDSLDYQGDQRKLYAFALVDGHSRMQYLEFAHSQSFETFVRCHVHAFQKLNGIAREIWYDNLATAVAEHDGRLVRFNPRFLAFAREFHFYPRACNQASGWEKGKVERGGVGYVRQNFWPLRDFLDLHDVNRQARSDQGWLFPSEQIVTPLLPDNVLRRCIHPRLEPLGLGWINFAVLRRSHSTLHEDRGTDPKLIADQQGHGLGVHLDKYMKSSVAQRREASTALWSDFKALKSAASASNRDK